MKTRVTMALMLVGVLATCGCGEKIKSPIDDSDPIPPLIQALESPSEMAQLAGINRLGQLGQQSQPAVPALQELARRKPKLKGHVDHAIGKIEGRIPLDERPPKAG